MERVVPTLVVALVIAGVFTLIWLGWRRRLKSQDSLPAPLRPVPEATEGMTGISGMYVVTTLADQPLERVNVHHLGLRTTAEVFVMEDGVVLTLSGVPDLFIPAADIRAVDTASGMVGKFVESGGLVVIRWRLGSVDVDTGLRPRNHTDTPELISAITELIEEP